MTISAWQTVSTGAELAEWRRAQGWTQTVAARWYNVKLRTWQRWETRRKVDANLSRTIAWRERLADRWPGGYDASGQPSLNPENQAAVDARRDARKVART